MKNTIVLNGHIIWLLPLLIFILTATFTIFTVCKTVEFFEEKDNKEEVDTKKEVDNNEEVYNKEEVDSKEEELDIKNLYKLEKLIKDIKNNFNRNKDIKKTKEVNALKPLLKENFVNYNNLSRIKKIRDENPKTFKEYNGQIKGYNCNEYSEYNELELDNNKYYKESSHKSNYIFPEREINNTGCINYSAKPHILNYENDVNKKILEYESMNILPKYKPEFISSIENPKYTYNRREWGNEPIITNDNIFEIGKLNVFNKKTPNYNII